MKQKLALILCVGMLISCTSTEGDKKTTEPTTSAKNEKEQVLEFRAIDSDEALIATALMAAPAESRAGCKVIGFNMAGEFTTLREGNNEFIVLADNPTKDGFNAACYHKDLEPFMARGRALRAEGKTAQEIFAIREAEMKSGKLQIPQGATLHIYYGSETVFDPKTSAVKDAQLRYVVYLPWATAESTGLPETPLASNHPWIMNPGTHRAHIMISPITTDKE